MRDLRIAVVAPCWFEIPPTAYGGIEWICAWLVEGLVAGGHDVTLVGAGANHTSARFLQTFPQAPSDQLGEVMPEVVHTARTHELLKGTEFDIVHDHTLAGPLLAPGRTCPTVVTAHGPVTGDLGSYYRAIDGFVHLVAISEAQRTTVSDLNWAGRVYNGIPVQDYPFVEHKQDYALFLGRMSPEKAAHLAIDAAREAGLSIVLAGKCIEPAEHAYFEEFVSPRLGEDTHWIGQVGPVRKKELLSGARCLVFPIQWQEPFGIVMVEALACGTPVVALNDGSVPEVITHEETGFIFDDPEDLVKGVDRSDQIDPAVCRQRAERLFDTAAMVKGYEAIYSKLV